MAAILPEKQLEVPIFDVELKTQYTAAAGQTEGNAMPGDCHTGRTVAAGSLHGNVGTGIKPKIDFRVQGRKQIDEPVWIVYNKIQSMYTKNTSGIFPLHPSLWLMFRQMHPSFIIVHAVCAI